MEAVSIGIGAWTVLSKRLITRTKVISIGRRSLYCQIAPEIMCVGNKSIGEGPINIVLRDEDWDMLRSRMVIGARLAFSQTPDTDPLTIAFTTCPVYDAVVVPTPTFDVAAIPIENLWEMVFREGKGPVLEAVAQEMNRAYPIHTAALFDKVVRQRTSQSLYLLQTGWRDNNWQDAIIKATKSLLGLGPGLTPSGDDLLVGYMSGLQLMSVQSRRARAIHGVLKAAVIASLALTNEISQAHIRWACNGYYTAPLVQLLAGITAQKWEKVTIGMRGLLGRGASSGTDTAIGLLWVLEQGKEKGNGYSLAY